MELPSWLDAPKIAGLAVVILAVVQYFKAYLPEKYIRVFAALIGIGLAILCDCYIGGPLNIVKAVVNGLIATVMADFGYKFLSDKPSKFALPSKVEETKGGTDEKK